ncbi:MAG: LOG family protein, partial [Hyphomonas sp.]
PELCFQFHYFAMRKMHFAMRARALVIYPGGFGTLDELFELLTLTQTGKSPAIPVVLCDRDFWSGIINFDALLEAGMISEKDLDIFEFADSAEEAWESLVTRGLSIEHAAD